MTAGAGDTVFAAETSRLTLLLWQPLHGVTIQTSIEFVGHDVEKFAHALGTLAKQHNIGLGVFVFFFPGDVLGQGNMGMETTAWFLVTSLTLADAEVLARRLCAAPT